MALKDRAASVLTKLKNQSKETGLPYQTCLQLFCQEEFLRKVERSKYANNFVLKGGMFLYVLTQFEGRPTRDIDFMIRWISNETENIKRIMEEICSVDTGNDFVRMEVLDVENITEEKEYHGVKTKFRTYIKNVRIPFSIDIGVDDVIVPGAIKRTVNTGLEGFRAPVIYTYSLESTIAEKFEAILKRMEATSRMKDFFDIYYLSDMFDFDGRKLQEAIFQTLEHRGTIYERNSFEKIKTFKENKNLVNLWNNYESGINDRKPEFDSLIERFEKFLEPIFQSIVNEDEFLAKWYSSKSAWLLFDEGEKLEIGNE